MITFLDWYDACRDVNLFYILMYSLRHHLFSSTAPITTGMNTTLTFQTYCNSIIKTWYLSIFFCYLIAMFWSPGIAKPIIWHLLIQIVSRNLVSMTLSVWIVKSQWILYSLFLWTDCGVCVRACVWMCVYRLTLHCKWCSYTAASAGRSQRCRGVFYIDF